MKDKYKTKQQLINELEKLRQQIAGLERAKANSKPTDKALKESEERFRAVFTMASDAIFIHDFEGKMLEVSEVACDRLGYSRDELLQMTPMDFNSPKQKRLVPKRFEQLKQKGYIRFETVHIDRKGRAIPVEIISRTIDHKGKGVMISTARDITERKRAEQELAEKQAALSAKTSELKELNKALRVLLKQRDEDKKEIEEKVLANVKDLALPYIYKLKKSQLEPKKMVYLNILESNLNEIVSPFIHQLSSKYSSLTPTEIQIAQLIKEGNSTKDIAELMGSSKRTVESHREHIRIKLGLKNKKVNLRSYLSSI